VQKAAVLVQKGSILVQKAVIPVQKALSLLASTVRVQSMEALAPTKAAKPPLQWTPGLAQQKRLRGTLLRQVPKFYQQLGRRSGECTEHNRGTWPRD
jgi:hypothetical protein